MITTTVRGYRVDTEAVGTGEEAQEVMDCTPLGGMKR